MSQKIRWGILGAGNIAQRFARSLAEEPSSELVGAAGRTASKVRDFCGEFSCQAFDSYDALVADPAIDAVYIAVPHAQHARWAKACLKAGKAVLCEKPCALTAQEAAEVVQVAMDEQVLFMEAMKCRFVPLYQVLLDMVSDGDFGEVGSIEIRQHLDYAEVPGYFTDPIGGGVLLDVATYGASWVDQFAPVDPHVEERTVRVADQVPWAVDARLRLGDVAVHMDVDADAASQGLENGAQATIAFSNGTVEVDQLHRPEHAVVRRPGHPDRILDIPYEVDDLYGEIHHFVELLQGGKTESPVMTFEDTIRCARILDACASGYDRYDLAESIALHVGDGNVSMGESMAEHTTFEVGGPADIFVTPESRSKLLAVLQTVRESQAPLLVLGKGSDLIVSDAGYHGVVVDLSERLRDVDHHGTTMVCQAGLPIIHASEMAAALSLSGLEFACGIPGTVGGAVYMNAGAYDGCCADVLVEAECVFPDGTVRTIPASDLDLGYRHSRVRDEGLVVVSATFQLEKGDGDAIRAKMDDLTERRESKQPLELPSAGSTFKRPEGHFAGKLIHDAGLQGYRVGGAEVSRKHAGFVVNIDHGTAQDILDVIAHVQEVVKEKFDVSLEPEAIHVPAFPPLGEKE